MQMLSAEQAAERLGVKLETVYAYVSRGALHSHRTIGDRRSTFDPAEVERLARRGRPRRSSRPPVLDFTITTSLTHIEGHRITYRGEPVDQLAATCSFEQVAELLWTGSLPSQPPTWTPPTWAPASWHPSTVDASTGTRATDGPLTHDPVDHLRTTVVHLAAVDPSRADLRPGSVHERARGLLAAAATSLPRPGGPTSRTPRLALAGRRPLQGSIAGTLWSRLSPGRARPGGVRALNAALVLLADHELASSTLAARVAASTRADPYAVVLAGLGPLAGPLHGGASRAVRRLLDDAAERGAATVVESTLRGGSDLPGFDHPLYPAGDPRAVVLLSMLDEAFSGARELAAVHAVRDAAHRLGHEPNVDFALAALGRVGDMPSSAGEVLFAVSRMAGWIAHALEEYGEAPLRFRARAVRAK